jgi:integrase
MWNNFVIRHVTMIARGQPISNARAMAKCDATLIYPKSIFDEAIEQEFLVKDPTRTLKIPKNLRPKDKQILTWEQLRAVLDAASQRDRILLMLDMTDALRPANSLLFAGSPSMT